MGAETLLSSQNGSRVFFELLKGRARVAGIARRCGLKPAATTKLLDEMLRAGLLEKGKGAIFDIDWERFVPLFLSQAMTIYSLAMRWKYVPYYVEHDPENVIEAAGARAERELAKVKVKLSGNDMFIKIVRAFFESLSHDIDAPEDFLADMRVHDAIDEFEYALVKLMPMVKRPKNASAQTREMLRLLGNWYRQIRSFDNTPTDTALRITLGRAGLIPV